MNFSAIRFFPVAIEHLLLLLKRPHRNRAHLPFDSVALATPRSAICEALRKRGQPPEAKAHQMYVYTSLIRSRKTKARRALGHGMSRAFSVQLRNARSKRRRVALEMLVVLCQGFFKRRRIDWLLDRNDCVVMVTKLAPSLNGHAKYS